MNEFINFRASKILVKFGVFILPFFALVFFILLRQGDRRLYLFLAYEDHFLEVLSAIIYLLSTVLGVLVVRHCIENRQLLNGWLYALFTLAMFIILGEEISWGQRILGIESPEYFVVNSSQQEINFHNLKPVQEILHTVYMAIGLLGGLMWVVLIISAPNSTLFNKKFIPGWYLMSYFLPAALFYFALDYLNDGEKSLGLMGRDQEPIEFLLSLGFFLFIAICYKRLSIQYTNGVDLGSDPVMSLNWISDSSESNVTQSQSGSEQRNP